MRNNFQISPLQIRSRQSSFAGAHTVDSTTKLISALPKARKPLPYELPSFLFFPDPALSPFQPPKGQRGWQLQPAACIRAEQPTQPSRCVGHPIHPSVHQISSRAHEARRPRPAEVTRRQACCAEQQEAAAAAKKTAAVFIFKISLSKFHDSPITSNLLPHA